MTKTEKTGKIIWLEKMLRTMSVLILKKYNPQVIAITGSVGKTSAKEAVFTVLSGKFRIRKSAKNYNNEIGSPLAVIGAESGQGSLWGWFKVFFKWLAVFVFPLKYPEILILEMGADRPGDIGYLTGFIKPDISIVTDVSFSHIEFFKTVEEIAREKGMLIKNLDEKGLAVLNADNEYVLKMKEYTRSDAITYGFSETADMRATDAAFSFFDDGEREIKGLNFKLNYKGTSMPVRLKHILARHQIYAVLAAAVAGTQMGMNLVEISEALSDFSSPPGRMNLLSGIKKSTIIDDTYNSSPASVSAALDTLGEIKAGRKIAVLGDMLELGEETEKSHRKTAEKFLEVGGDVFFAVGRRMRFAVSELEKNGFRKESIFVFGNPLEAGKMLQKIIRPGDLILVKGSQGMRMEKIVEEVMAEPEKAGEVLCRQAEEWKKRPFRET